MFVEYTLPKPVFETMVASLEGTSKYRAHEYFGMKYGTIDDGSSNDSEYCKRFSVFKHLDDGKSIEL